MAVELYFDIVVKMCSDNHDFCNVLKDDFSSLASSLEISCDLIKDMTKVGVDKLRFWYEEFRGQ